MGVAERYNEKKKKRAYDSGLSSTSKGVAQRYNEKENGIASVQGVTNKSEGLFKSGRFDDGYDFGDVTLGLLGTIGDAAAGIVQGAGGLVEGVSDLLLYGVSAGVSQIDGGEPFGTYMKEVAKKDSVGSFIGDIREDIGVDDASFLGDLGYNISQGLGQVGAIIATGGIGGAAGLGSVGATALTTGVMGASSMGSGIGEAYQGGATDGEAFSYGLMKGAVDAGTELIFGGLGKAVKAVGLSKGISSLDDVFAKKLGSKISSTVLANAAELGVKASAEGFEEVMAGYGSAFAKWITYMSDEDLKQIVEDENIMEQFVVGAITSGIAQGADFVKATKSGRDFVTGFSANEESVIEAEVESRVAEAEQNGTKLTKKQKNEIYEQVQEDLKKGYISTDRIESVLGGETYKSYKDTVDSEDAILKEFEDLGKKQNATLAEQARYAELQAKVKEIESNSQRGALKSQLSDEVQKSLTRQVGKNTQTDDYLMESYNEKARRSVAFEADLSQYDEKTKATVQKAIDSGILNNTRRTHEFVDMIAKISADKGVLFDFTNNEKLKNSGFAVDGKTVNGYVTKDGVTLNIQSAKSLNSVVGHEITHILEGTELYETLKETITEYAKAKGDYEKKRKDIEELYKDVKDADLDGELTADLVGDYLFIDPDFIKNLSTKHRNVFQKIYDEIKYLCRVATKGSREARRLEKVKRAFESAYKENIKAKENTAEGGAKYSIVQLEDGRVYVEASRKVINGDTKAEQRREITNFFSELLGDNSSLDIHTIEGDVLTITKAETANKARDDFKTVNGQKVRMSDNEFAVKLHVESHIDEVTEVSTKIGKETDNKDHSFANDGFTYRRAYFKDFDGQYYEVTLSIGHNGSVATVYNVGKIKEGVSPSAKIIAVVGSQPLGKTPSGNSIPQNSEKSTENRKNSFSIGGEDIGPIRGKASENTKYSLSETTDGKFVAVVDSDILSNIDTSSWDKTKKDTAKKAASEALKKFNDGIVVDGITRKVNRVSRREYTRSKYTENLYKKAPDIFADKMRAADVADDIVVAATNWSRDGGLTHDRNDNFVDFDHGQTLIMSGNTKYSAEVVVGITDKGEAVFYDVVDMTPTTFDIKEGESSTTATMQNAVGDIYENSPNGIIPQNPEKSTENRKNSFSIGGEDIGPIRGKERVESYTEAEQKNTAESGVKYSLYKQKSPTYEELAAKNPIQIIKVSDGIESGRYADMKAAAIDKAKSEGWFDMPHYNEDTDSFIFLTSKSFAHAYSNLTADFGEDTIRCMAHIPEIIKESILVNVADPKDSRKNETKVYTFLGAIEGINGVEPVKLTVKEFDLKSLAAVPQNIRNYFEKNGIPEKYNSLYDAHALEVIGIEGIQKEPDASGKVGEIDSRAQATSDSTISIADLLNLVKGNAEKYIPQKSGDEGNLSLSDIKADIGPIRGKERVESYTEAEQKNTAEDGDVKTENTRWSISPNLENDLDDLLKGKFDASRNEIYIGETSSFMTDVIGAKSMALYMPASKAYSSLLTEKEYAKRPYYSKQPHYHGLGKSDFIEILEKSESPVAAFVASPDEQGNSRENRIVLVTDKKVKDLKTGEEGYAVVIEEVDSVALQGGKRIKANKAITVYPRTQIGNDIQLAIADNRILDITKKGGHLFAGVRGSNSQAAIRKDILDKNIAHFWDNVKWKNEKNKKTSFSDSSTLTTMQAALMRAGYIDRDGHIQYMQDGENHSTDGKRSLSESDDLAPIGSRNIYGSDVRLETAPTQAEMATARSDVTAEGNNTTPDTQNTSAAEFSDNEVIDLTTNKELAQKVAGLHGSPKYKAIQEYILDTLVDQPITLNDGKEAVVDKRDALHIANKSGSEKTAQIAQIKEIVEKATLYAEDDNVEHKKFNYFCYYKINVKYGQNTYSLYLNVGRGINDGKYHLYDITKKIRDTANRINGLERPKPNEGYALENDVSNNSIPHASLSVKKKVENPEDIGPVRMDIDPEREMTEKQKKLSFTESFAQKTMERFGMEKLGGYVYAQQQVRKTLPESFFKSVKNIGSDTVVSVTRKGINESFGPSTYGKIPKALKLAKLATVDFIPEAIREGTLVLDNQTNYHDKNSPVRYAYIEYDIELEGQPCRLKIDVRKSDRSGSNRLHVHSVNLTNKKVGDRTVGSQAEQARPKLSPTKVLYHSSEDLSSRAEKKAEDIGPIRMDIDSEREMTEKQKKLSFTESLAKKTMDGFGIQNLGDYVHVQRQVFDTLLREDFFTDREKRSRTDINEETGMVIETNKSSISETFNQSNYGRLGKAKKLAKLDTVRMLPQIIKKGKLLRDNVPNQYRNSANKTFAYITYELNINGTPVTVKLDIKKSPSKNKLWVHSILMTKNSTGLDVYLENEVGTSLRTDANADDQIGDTQKSGGHHNLSSAETVYHSSEDLSSRAEKKAEDIGPIRADIGFKSNSKKPNESMEPIEIQRIRNARERLAAKLENKEKELENNRRMRVESQEDFDREIARLQTEYNSKKNKKTKIANDLLRRIDRLRRLKSDVDADYAKRISDLEKSASNIKDAIHDKRVMAAELNQARIKSIKSKFAEQGLDFDKVLKNAKNLSTFSTVDNTPQRVMEKALGYEAGRILADETVNKVAQNETEGIRWLNSFTNRKNGELAKLSKRYGIKPGSKESAAAQMYAEGFYVNQNGDCVAYGDAELAKDFPDERVRENIVGLSADPRIRQIYDDTLEAINQSRERNGYPKIPRLDNYFLHFRAMDDTFSKLGIPFNPNDIKAKDLPTDLNGVTANLKPGQPYFASAKHRIGNYTSFDLLGGLERYLTGAKNQIYHIDDIQTLRALRNYIADGYGQAKGLESLNSLSEEEAQDRIKQVYNAHLSTFAKFLNEEANIIAGKTSLIDRGLEGVIGRRGIAFLDTVNKQVGSNMVGFNVSSSLTNLISGVQAIAKTDKLSCIKAFAQTTKSRIDSLRGKTDSFAESNPTMIRRKGADRFYRTPFQKVGDAGYVLMSAVDNVTTEFIVRAKYNEFVKKGMNEQEAVIEADKWASRLLGDRSLGQMPQLYNSKMLGVVTKFQLEVRNQLDSQFYDTIKEEQATNKDIQDGLKRNTKTAAKVAATFFELAVLQHLFGVAFESVAGYNPTFDIIDVLIKTLGLDDEEDENTVMDNVEEGFLTLLEDLPYTSILSGGRIPISSAMPIEQFVRGEDEYGNEKSRLETLGEIAPYYVLPTGYNQIKKTVQGLSVFDDDLPISGSYTDSGNLRFPVDDTLLSRVQAGLFGQWSNKNAREYFDGDMAPLNEKQIQEYIDVGMPIQDYWDYREGLSQRNTMAEKAEYINSLNLTVEQKNILINNVSDRKEKIDMSDFNRYGSFEEFDFAQKFSGQYAVAKSVGGYEKYKTYSDALSKIESDNDSSGKSISGSRKKKVIEYINNLDADYGEKIILFKNQYNADDTYNYDIIEYLNSREDISYDEMVEILKELGFTVHSDGRVTW